MATPDPGGDDEAAVAALYGGPLGDFVAGRDERARALRAGGRRDEAAALKALRKPSLLAWSLDAARQADPEAVEALVAAVADLSAAQDGDGDLRAALGALREAQARVVEAAVAATSDHGQPVARAQVAPALLAVVSDPEALAALHAGRLAAVPEAGGLGVAFPAGTPAVAGAPAPRSPRSPRTRAGLPRKAAAPPAARPAAAPRPRPAQPRRVAGAAGRVLARAEAAAAAAAETAAQAEARADAAEQEAKAADRAVEAARRQAGTARHAADLARQKATAAAAARAKADERVAAARAAMP